MSDPAPSAPVVEPPRRPEPSRLEALDARVRAAGQALLTAGGGRHWIRRAAPAAPLSAPYPKVFVVGCPRSGTTWVAGILGRHPRVIGGKESHLYPRLHRPLVSGGRFSVRGWSGIYYGIERGRALDRPAGVHHYVDRPTLDRLARATFPTSADDRTFAGALARRVLDTHFARGGGTDDHVLVEKTPLHVLYGRDILADFPEARLVEVVRDGRDVCVSMQMRAARVPVVPRNRSQQIALWVRSVRAGLELHGDPALRDRVITVRYEDLKADPEREIARLYEKTELGGAPDLVAAAADATDIDRYQTGEGEFRFRGESGTWAEHFGDDDERLFRELAGDAFREAGYAF